MIFMNQNSLNNIELQEEIKVLIPKLFNSLLEHLQANISGDFSSLLDKHSENFLNNLENNQKQLEEINQNVTKLSRLQYKANTLSETQEKNLTSSLTRLQEVIKSRDELEENLKLLQKEQLTEEKRRSRGELAIELLPVLDGIEAAINNGLELLKNKHLKEENLSTDSLSQKTEVPQIKPKEQPNPTISVTKVKKLTFLERLKIALKGEILIEETFSVPTTLVEDTPKPTKEPSENLDIEKNEALMAWLSGLELVRERFIGILANEGIRVIETEGQLFDPRLHIALEAIVNSELPAGTITSVLRKGYRQDKKILRYAEVNVVKKA